MRSHFEAEGQIRGTDLLGALVALWREGASGTLQFSRSGATAGFDVAAGDVVRTASSDPRFDTAAILVRAGKLDQPTLDRLPVGEGADRAAVALQTGVLTRREWRWGEKIRAVEVLSDLLTWLEGDYWFFRTGAQGSADFRLTIPRLILELFLRSRDRNLVLHYLGGADVPLARAATFDAEFPSFGLTADAESVVQLIDGERTAEEIASEAPADAFAVEKLLAALVTLGLVHPEFAPGEERTAVSSTSPVEEPLPEATEEPSRAFSEGPAAASADAEREAEQEGREIREEEERVAEEEVEENEEVEEEEPRGIERRPPQQPADADLRKPQEPETSAAAAASFESLPANVADDEAERGLAGGSYEEGSFPERYDDRMDEDDDEPEPGDEDSGLGDQELDHDRFRAEESERADEDEGRYALDEDRHAEEEVGERPVRPDTAAGAPADLLGLDEGGAAPSSPFDRPLDATTGVGMGDRPRPRSIAAGIWVLAGLAVAVLAVLVWRSRETGPGEGAARLGAGPAPSPTPIQLSATVSAPLGAAAPTAAAEAPMPSPTPMRIGPTAAPLPAAASGARPAAGGAGPAPTPAPARAATSARPAAPTAHPPAAAAERRAAAPTIPPPPKPKAGAASEGSRQTWLDRAERDRRRYGKARYAIQLELACEVTSLVDAFQHDRPAGSMWLLATPFQGRTCFRVLWGRYNSRQEAARGLSRAPAFFSTAQNHPAVVSIR